MAMTFEASPKEYDAVLEDVNLGFTSVFITETTLKIIAYGFKGIISYTTIISFLVIWMELI